MCVAYPHSDGWHLEPPEPVGPPQSLLARLRTRAAGAPVAFGIDCPIGLPRAYAAHLTDAADFPTFLRQLRDRPAFFTVAATLADVTPATPFYPARGLAGMKRHAHAHALGLPDAAALCRACDRATAERPAGAPIFWTLGANQSGKAAISAWRDMLIPALHAPDPPRLWPFAGPLLKTLRESPLVVAETYPAEAMRHLGLRIAGSKRRQADRAAYAADILRAMQQLPVTPAQKLHNTLQDGFGPGENGEDQFDCVLGVLCVLGVINGTRPDSAPDDYWINAWEGWVLGQTSLPQDGKKEAVLF